MPHCDTPVRPAARPARQAVIISSSTVPISANSAAVEVVDPMTVRLHLSVRDAPLLAFLADRSGMMLSPRNIAALGENVASHPVCAGPYSFTERVAQDRIVLDRFPDYWDAANIHVSRITFLPIPDSTVRLANLQSGALEMVQTIDPDDVPAVRRNARLRFVVGDELGYQGITINVAKGEPARGPLGQDPRVRQALSLAIDREALNQVVYNGAYIPGNQWVSPEHPYYQQRFPVPKRDVAQAKRLIQQSGAKTPITVDLMVPNNPETRQAAEVIQTMTAEAGFDLKIRVTEFATSLKEAEEGRYQAYMLNWSGRPDPDGNLFIFHKTGGPQNVTGYSNPDVDALLDEARTRVDPGERKALYEKAAEALLDRGSIIYVYHRRWIIAHTAKLEGFKLLPDGLVRVVGLKLK